jgi:lactoylglutathione lyase
MKLGYTIVYVPDVLQAVEFYERAFALERKFVHESGQYGEMDTGSTTLAFAADELAAENVGIAVTPNRATAAPAGIELVFVTPDVAKGFATAVKAGARAVAAPTEKPWGQTVAYVRDLNGVLVEIASPM